MKLTLFNALVFATFMVMFGLVVDNHPKFYTGWLLVGLSFTGFCWNMGRLFRSNW